MNIDCIPSIIRSAGKSAGIADFVEIFLLQNR